MVGVRVVVALPNSLAGSFSPSSSSWISCSVTVVGCGTCISAGALLGESYSSRSSRKDGRGHPIHSRSSSR